MPNLDFDKLRQDKEDFDVTIDGERVVFPKQVPADIVLNLRRKALKISETDEAAQTEFFLEMGEALMPSDIFDRLRVALGLTELFQVIDELCLYYGIHERDEAEAEPEGGPEGESDEGKGQRATPETEARAEQLASSISLPTSEQLRPTSNVFGLVPTTSYEPESSTGDVSSAG